MGTFRLTNINLQVNRPLFETSSRKMIKILIGQPKSRDHQILQTQSIAQITNSKSILWDEEIILPARVDKKYQFQIINQAGQTSQYGNPQVIESVLEGSLVIKKDEGDYSGWEVYCNGSSIGYLFANIQFFNKSGTKKAMKQLDQSSLLFGHTMAVKKDHIAITSIYGNFPVLNPLDKLRVYIQFKIGGASVRSSIKRLKHNEYRSYQTLEAAHPNPHNTKLTASGLIFDTNSHKTIIIGSGSTNLILQQSAESMATLQLHERIKLQKVFLYDEQNEEVGWLSFKYIKTKEQCLDPRFFLQDRFSTMGDVNFRTLNSQLMTISQVKGASPRKMSGLQSNSRIFVPRAQRFTSMAKKWQCQKIGVGHTSLDHHSLPTTQKYKMASFGFGYKQAPVERDKDIPGPGRYMTPNLFDCYK